MRAPASRPGPVSSHAVVRTGTNAVPAHLRWRAHVIGLLGAVAVAALGLSLAIGAVPISMWEMLRGASTGLDHTIFMEIRAPRVVLAGFVGATLALAGASLQGLFRNPLADPGLIGVSSGGALGAVCLIVGAPTLTGALASYALPLAAVAGSVSVTAFLYVFSSRFGQFSIVTIVLVGIAVNALAGVGIGLFQYVSDDASLRTLTFWMMGSFGSSTWSTVLPAVVIMAVAALPLLFLGRGLDLLQLGEATAFHLGIDVRRLKRRVILCTAVAVGAGVAVSGIIGFIGLVVPHLVRLAIGANHRFVLAGAVLLGAALAMLADTVARSLLAPAEIPVSLITSALGAPFFLWLITRVRPA